MTDDPTPHQNLRAAMEQHAQTFADDIENQRDGVWVSGLVAGLTMIGFDCPARVSEHRVTINSRQVPADLASLLSDVSAKTRRTAKDEERAWWELQIVKAADRTGIDTAGMGGMALVQAMADQIQGRKT